MFDLYFIPILFNASTTEMETVFYLSLIRGEIKVNAERKTYLRSGETRMPPSANKKAYSWKWTLFTDSQLNGNGRQEICCGGGWQKQNLDGNGESQRVEQREGGGESGAELRRRNAYPHVRKGLTQKMTLLVIFWSSGFPFYSFSFLLFYFFFIIYIYFPLLQPSW